jgi:hypothetical protein
MSAHLFERFPVLAALCCPVPAKGANTMKTRHYQPHRSRFHLFRLALQTLCARAWIGRGGRATAVSGGALLRRSLPPRVLSLVFVSLTLFFSPRSEAQTVASPVQTENALPGTADWKLSKPATRHEIEGYASATSVNRGDTIQLFVNTASPTYAMRFFRIGWYQGLGGREVQAQVLRPGVSQIIPKPDPTTHIIECHWTDPYQLTIPQDWTSGFYLVQLNALNAQQQLVAQSYLLFVVRDDTRPSDFLFQSSVTTFQAYNPWGGFSLYSFGIHGTAQVSFDRPYGQDPLAISSDGIGAGQFISTGYKDPGRSMGCGWEINCVRFLEREGYDVEYCTDIDTHERGDLLLQHKAFLSVGHDEYWSPEMRVHVENARDAGVNLAFFSSDTCDWYTQFYPNASGVPDRRMTRIAKWTFPQIGDPQARLIGVTYNGIAPINTDIVIKDAGHWICAATGLASGDHLPGLAGYETDRVSPDSPAGIEIIAASPYKSPYSGNTVFTHVTVYTAASGALVFASGSMQWSWGLDDFNAPQWRPSVLSAAAQQMTRNILARFAALDSLSGTITLEGCQNAAQSISMEFRCLNSGEVFARTVLLHADGSFRISHIQCGQYSVRIKGEKWLAHNITVDTSNGDEWDVAVTLPAGDVNSDNVVDSQDVAALADAFGSTPADSRWNEDADLNGDGKVDIEDLGLLASNFGKRGDQ